MTESIRLTQLTQCAGCAGKIPPAFLSKAVHGLKWHSNSNVLQAMEGNEDCGVYKLNDTEALVQTTDFFSPVVDDPYTFGQIAAANALSDIYAMAAQPLSALNIVCFPQELGEEVLRQILAGGEQKAAEANCPVIGGHSIRNPEVKYGMAVTGKAKINEIVYNRGARPGDLLILTKPLGTGILNTAIKKDTLDEETKKIVIETMIRLNNDGGRLMQEYKILGATDVTGFSLIGHAMELSRGSQVDLRIFADNLPKLPKVLEQAKLGNITGGSRNNRIYTEGFVTLSPSFDEIFINFLFDPQTSGGLLIAVPREKQEIISALKEFYPHTSIIGECLKPANTPGMIHVEA